MCVWKEVVQALKTQVRLNMCRGATGSKQTDGEKTESERDN